ncbi:MAG: thioredoxin family protein [Pleurocapsa sp.]
MMDDFFPETEESTIGNYAPDFEIPGINKEVYHLGTHLKKFKAIAVVFMSNDTPGVDNYIERLKQIQTEFESQGFTVIGIDSNYRDEPIAKSFESMTGLAQKYDLNFPYLRDPTQDVAKSFMVQVMPTVFLLDNQAVIRYAGRIDDSPESVDGVKNHYLRDSIASVLAGKNLTTDYIEPVGSPIVWRPKN